MKIDAICEDSHGNTITVLVDLDYTDPYDYSALIAWCEEELHHHMNKFDVFDFKIANYDQIVESAANEAFLEQAIANGESAWQTSK